ncbi:hypothetical protein [Undibacterium crateris]|uniref:hypothetical protein n=1 Tax=Undibacterium crateris TaxID=2528175 RepID=UPI0013893B88|nr:hypothetical protein [Undibacterium crateris]NDI85076.1 hypothetical protein [Undibacterium crateris]
MLNSIPKQIAKGARSVTLKHPNAFDCDAYRKVLSRGSDGQMGGVPTMGGLGVLDSEDEDDVDWHLLGDCKMLQVGTFEPSSFNDRETTLDVKYTQMIALIESLADPDTKEYFIADKHDVIFINISESVAIGFEIVDIIGDINIAPYTRKYVLEKRDELLYVNGFKNLP